MMLQDRTTQRHYRLFKRGPFSRILHFDGVLLCADVGIKWCWYGQECAVSDLFSSLWSKTRLGVTDCLLGTVVKGACFD